VRKVALVTAAASGIGAACARALADAGYAVLAGDIALGAAEAAFAGDDRITPVLLDVTDEAAWDREVAGLARFDVLVNNAGIGLPALIVDTTLEAWRRQMAVNLDGCFLGVRAALRRMLPQRSGVIINMASLGAMRGTPMNAAYCASKAGVHLLTRSAAREAAMAAPGAAPGVRVVSVHPGLIDTPGATSVLDASFPDGSGPEMVAGMIPAQRMGRPEEVAAMVVWLASDAAAYTTGGSFTIDGGMNA
jgi:NAD(P)-dependent dehydrogenase (short-subunit alcohol dehydrogenase family)